MKKILIIDDEIKLRNELKKFLENNGYEVSCLTDFNNVISDILQKETDLILLDINLPNINGEFICKELRKKITTPIIMITSKNTEIDEIISINYGADDFITKPYNSNILLARIERLIERAFEKEVNLKYKDLVLDLSKSAIIKENQLIDLSRNEFKIFYYLVKNIGKIISRDNLMNYLWDNDEFVDDNTLTVNINRLRNKLESIGYFDIIITKRGQGYIIL